MPAVLCFVLLTAWIHPSTAIGADQKPPWLPYETAMKRSKAEHLPVMLFFRTRWCYQCAEMEETVLSHSSVLPILGEKFLPVEVDIGKETQLKETYRINYVPTTIFIDSEGKTALVLRGLVKKTRFLKALRYVTEGHYRRMDFMRFEDTDN